MGAMSRGAQYNFIISPFDLDNNFRYRYFQKGDNFNINHDK